MNIIIPNTRSSTTVHWYSQVVAVRQLHNRSRLSSSSSLLNPEFLVAYNGCNAALTTATATATATIRWHCVHPQQHRPILVNAAAINKRTVATLADHNSSNNDNTRAANSNEHYFDDTTSSTANNSEETRIPFSSTSSFRNGNNKRKNNRHPTATASTTTSKYDLPNTKESMMELYDILMSKQMGTFRYPNDYTIYANSIIRFAIHINTTTMYGNFPYKPLSPPPPPPQNSNTNHSSNDLNDQTTASENNNNNNNNIGMTVDTTHHHHHHQRPQQQQQHQQHQHHQGPVFTNIINSAFRLWERTIYEYSLYQKQRFNPKNSSNDTNDVNDTTMLWFHSHRIFEKLLLKWKQMALSSIRTVVPKSSTTNSLLSSSSSSSSSSYMDSKHNNNNNNNNRLIPAMNVLQTIQTISKHQSSLGNISSYNIVLQVLLAQYQKEESFYTAPILIDKFIHKYMMPQPHTPPSPQDYEQPSITKQYTPLSTTSLMHRDGSSEYVDMYSSNNHQRSGSTNVSIKPNIFTYTVLLRAWIHSNHPLAMGEIEFCLATIQDLYWQQQNVIPNLNNKKKYENSTTTTSATTTTRRQDILTPHMLAIRYYASIGDIKEVDAIFHYLQRIDDLPDSDQYSLLLSEMIQSYCNRCIVTKSGIVAQEKHIIQAEDLFDVLHNSVINQTFDTESRKMLPIPIDDYTADNIKAVVDSATSIMNTYRALLRPIKKQVNHGAATTVGTCRNSEINDGIITRAEAFYEQIQKYEHRAPVALGRMRLVLMDIYANANRLEQVETLFEQYRDAKKSTGSDNIPYGIVIKAYNNCNQPERAEQLVQRMLRDENERNLVDIEVINVLIEAWEECTTSNRTIAADRAHQIYRWIYDHPICIQLKLQPNLDTYTLLFQCLAKAGSTLSSSDTSTNDSTGSSNSRNKQISKGIVSKVETLLNEIEHQYVTGRGHIDWKPDVLMYNCAILACLNCREYDQAEYILQLMEHRMSSQQQLLQQYLQQQQQQQQQPVLARRQQQRQTSPFNNSQTGSHTGFSFPDTRTYSLILNCYSKLRTSTGAEWAEQLHNHMRKLSETINPLLKPTVNTYNMVMTGWALSTLPNATDRLWKVYEQMTQVDNMELDAYNYTTLISALSKSLLPNDLQRAIDLLQIMQTKAKASPNQSKIHPDGRHYCMVLKACVDLKDVDTAAYVMNMYIDAYLMQRCRPSDHPDRKIFLWIVTTWTERNELLLASWFMFDTMTAIMKANNPNSTVSSSGNAGTTVSNGPMSIAIPRLANIIGIDYIATINLRDAWMASQHAEKEKYLVKIKTMILEPLFHRPNKDVTRRTL